MAISITLILDSNHYTIINDYDLDAELIGNNGLLIDSGNCSLNSFSPDSLTSAGAGNGLGLALTIGNGSSTTSSTSSMINTMTLTNGSSTSTNCNKGIIHSQSSRTNNTPFMSDISLDNLLANWEVSATTSQTMINSLDEACTNHSSAPNETSSPTSIVLASSSSMLHSIVPSQSHSQQFSTLQQQSGNVTIVGNVSNEKTRQQSQTRNVNGNNSRKRLIQPMSSSAVTYSNRRSLNNKVNASNSSSLSTSSSTTTESLSTLGSKVSSSSTQLSPTSTSTLRSTSTNQLMSSTSTAAERASTSLKTAATSNHIISNDSTNFNQHGNNNNNINMKRLKMRQVEENVPLTSVVSSGLTISTISFRSNGGNSIANNNGMNNQSINVTLNGNHSQSSSTLTNNNNSTNGQYMSSATPGTGTRNSRMIDTEISDEERRLLTKEGYPTFPSNPAALTKVEEKILRKIRRKIRNKRSAQSSRQRKKEYVEELERRCAESINMSQFYKKECVRLRRELAEFHRRFQRFNLLSANTVLSSDHSRLAQTVKQNARQQTQTSEHQSLIQLCNPLSPPPPPKAPSPFSYLNPIEHLMHVDDGLDVDQFDWYTNYEFDDDDQVVKEDSLHSDKWNSSSNNNQINNAATFKTSVFFLFFSFIFFTIPFFTSILIILTYIHLIH
ncbi:bZIP transcription factor [Blomia tropicalis]|nr:bZIP transcription factor [Blomia tropicalis]